MNGAVDELLPTLPLVETLTKVVVPASKSRRKTSVVLLVSPATRSGASLANTTNRPLVETIGPGRFVLPPPMPLVFTLTSVVVFDRQSRRNNSLENKLLPLAVRSFARLVNSTNRPSGVNTGATESPLPPAGRATRGLWLETSWMAARNCGDTVAANTSRKVNRAKEAVLAHRATALFNFILTVSSGP